MKKLVLIVIALCTFAPLCNDQDTKIDARWVRLGEPRLTAAPEWQRCASSPLQPGQVVLRVKCERTVPTPDDCDDLVRNPADAQRLLARQPACLDAAIPFLRTAAQTDPAVLSDLAGAYYARAQRDDQPTDLLEALAAANKAVTMTPGNAAARFNRALIQEALGLDDDAVASWNGLLQTERGAWAAEARSHRNAVARRLATDAMSQWTRSQPRIPAALRARDRPAVTRIIESAPGSALAYFENELLPQWADDPSADRLREARLFAEELSRITKDRYAVDAVQSIKNAQESPAALAALREGLRAFRDGRRWEEAFEIVKSNAPYDKAARLLAGRSPLHATAVLGHAVPLSHSDLSGALRLLGPIEEQAERAAHRHLSTRIRLTRAYFLSPQRLVEAISIYDRSIHDYRTLGDQEGLAKTYSRLSGDWVTAGENKRAWRHALEAMRYAPSVSNAKDRHVVLGAAASAATALGHAPIALSYQEWAVRLLQNELRRVPPDQLARIAYFKTNLVRAYRERARIHLALNDPVRATSDLNEARRLEEGQATKRDVNVRVDMEMRTAEVSGRLFLQQKNAKRAVQELTRGIDTPAAGTLRASMLAQRAEAHSLANHPREAKADLQEALATLHAEERRIVDTPLGAGEQLWSPYFSRFQDTYRKLIRQLAEEGRWEEAFSYAERARAFEPLHRILQSRFAPPSFRQLIRNDDTIELAEIQASLPEDTFLLEYCVLEDQTYVWIISRHEFQHRVLPTATRASIQRWTDALQDAAQRHHSQRGKARERNAQAFYDGLQAPYEALLAPALKVIRAKRPGAGIMRLVLIPDGAIHGLPMAALRSAATPSHHLIEEATVSFAGSASLYLYSLLRDEALPPGDSSALLVGDPAFDPNLPFTKDLRRLPGAAREVHGIHRLYPSAEVMLDRDATVPRFLEKAPGHAILHVAAHAISTLQLILFARSENESGALDAHRLLTELKLQKTRLVVLAACGSAGGLPVGPEGVAPLVRPFIISGVPAVVGSLWDVDDATAEPLLVSFHRVHQQGKDAAEALRAAQLELLRTEKPGHYEPVLTWAPFQVIGHGSSPYAAQHQQ